MMIANTPIRLSLAALAMALALPASANDLLECRDPGLAGMDSVGLSRALRAAGGVECRTEEHAWAETVQCAAGEGSTAYGLPLRELRAEITNAGVRRLVIVSSAGASRAQQAVDKLPQVEGLQRDVEQREDGASLIRCVAQGGEVAPDAGGIVGSLPPLPADALVWQVCALADGAEVPACVRAEGDRYRFAALAPGVYRIYARPLGGEDESDVAVLSRSPGLRLGERGDLLFDRIAVRPGAMSEAMPLTALRVAQQ
jgi:hypothetical protein